MGVQGQFSLAKYESSVGTFIFPIKVQPETIAFEAGGQVNSEPSGSITANLPSAVVSKSRRSIGVHPRTVSVKVTATGVTANNAVGTIIQIPVLSKAAYAAYKKGDTGIYQGDTVRVVGKNEEKIV